MLIFIIVLLIINFKFIVHCIRAIKFSMPKEQLRSVVKTLIKSLCDSNIIKTQYRDIKIQSKDIKDNVSIELSINGVTTHENNIIITSLEEIFSDIDSQRYILINKKRKIDTYYNVPNILATNKELAQRFHSNWIKYIGDSNLIYTKSLDGRKILLEARKNTFNYINIEKFIEKKKPISNWK